MGAIADRFLKISRQLYPKGRAFKMPEDGILESLHKALSLSEERLWDDVKSTLDSSLPDNDNFTAEDATRLERAYGIISNSNVSLEDRKLAIKRKMNHPGTVRARQHYLYLQGQLQAAGFDVYVYENRFDDGAGGLTTKTPEELSGGSFITDVEHGEFEHGENEHGGFYNNLIANHIDEDEDLGFEIGDNLRSTFFIGGDPIGSFAVVDEARKKEFRQLVLRIKPVQSIAFLFIHYY